MKPADREARTVAVDGLGKRYGSTWVVRNVAFSLGPGAMLGLVGANGGGKTTTLRMLAGLVRPDAGAGHVFAHDIGKPSTALRRTIGYMSQRLSLYPELSVAENLAFRAAVLGLPNRPDVIARAADRCEGVRHRELEGQILRAVMRHRALRLDLEPMAHAAVVPRRLRIGPIVRGAGNAHQLEMVAGRHAERTHGARRHDDLQGRRSRRGDEDRHGRSIGQIRPLAVAVKIFWVPFHD